MQDTPNDSATPTHAMSPAMLRMTRSRIALRQVLQIDTNGEASVGASSRASGHILGDFFDMLKGQPTAQLLLNAAQGIWAKNPWMIFGKNAFEAGNILLLPIAQRSPLKLVAGAFVFGAALCVIRPWRLVKGSTLIASLLHAKV